MKKLLYSVMAALLAMSVFAPAALAQGAKCADFNGDQAAAQAALPDNPQLDRNKDGIACNDLLKQGGSDTPQQPDMMDQSQMMDQQSEQPQMMEQTTMRETTGPLPKSGGMGMGTTVLLPASALLLGSGVLAFAVLRRR